MTNFAYLMDLLIMSAIICVLAPLMYDAAVPANLPVYFGSLAVFIAVSLSVGGAPGLLLKRLQKE